jgi:hypothetical protein
MEEEKM